MSKPLADPNIVVRRPVVIVGHGKTENLYFECGLCEPGAQRFHIKGGLIVKRCERGHDYELDFMSCFGKVEAVFKR